MNIIDFIVRALIAFGLFVFLVAQWAIVPLFDETKALNMGFFQVFYGNNTPQGMIRDVMLTGRLLFGLAFTLWVLIPAVRMFANVDARPVANFMLVALLLLSIVAFFGSMVVQYLYYQ
jgi:hypothetical protein